ncbi:hypothetical protein ACIRP0_28865 [Streptomyces sp. NPDC101733]|uniref:DUF7144 family membrane protein n=1 Tax=unclassified Streptomyces TaxID=2593676 RepID=UPI003830C119
MTQPTPGDPGTSGASRTAGTAHTAPPSRAPSASSPWAAGGVAFAGVLLLLDGVLSILKGIVAIAQDSVYSEIGDYVFRFNVTAWGWILLVLGVILVVVGAGILKGAGWARGLGVALACLSLVANFLWLPYQPLWALISIAIDVFVIWALCTDRPHQSHETHAVR